MADVTEKQLVEELAGWFHGHDYDTPWEDCEDKARRWFDFMRAHASEVCRLLGGAGPEEVEAVRDMHREAQRRYDQVTMPRAEAVWDARIRAYERVLAALGGEEQG